MLFHLPTLALLLLSSLSTIFSLPTAALPVTTTVATKTTTVASTSSGCSVVGALRPRSTGPPIVAVTTGTSIYKLEVKGSAGGPAALVPFGYRQGWTFASGAWGVLFFANPSCMRYLYLNVGDSEYSYKPLTWSWTKITTYWAIPYGADIGTSAASPYGVVTDFLACGSGNTLYLQTGTDTPAGQTCVVTKLRQG